MTEPDTTETDKELRQFAHGLFAQPNTARGLFAPPAPDTDTEETP